jgi:hypothetical protein
MYSLRRNASIVCRSLQGTPANGVSVEDDMAVDRSLAFWYENRKHDSQRKFGIFADFFVSPSDAAAAPLRRSRRKVVKSSLLG